MLEGTSGSPLVQASIPIQHTNWVSVYYNRLVTLVLRFPVTHLMTSAALRCLRVSIMSDLIIHRFSLHVIPYIQFPEQEGRELPFLQ